MALKLYKENGEDVPAWKYVDDAAPPSGYTETDDIADWDLSHNVLVESTVLKFTDVRDKISTAYAALGAPTTREKEIASAWFVIDESVRDGVHSAEEQEANATHYVNHLVEQNTRTFLESNRDLIKDADVASIDTTTDDIIV